MLQRLAIILVFFSVAWCHSQTLSPDAEISVLTIGPGDNLNDAFGHSAFRVKDQTHRIDLVYGYGEYDFDTPNFYLKFAQGKLEYQMSKHNFYDIYRFYTHYDRTIEEQVLNLSQDEKEKLFRLLTENFKPENRKYRYDFFFDNCATRIRDVLQQAVEDSMVFVGPKDFKAKTFRSLIYDHTGKNNWGSFGIDLALGSVIDKTATPYEHMFLPKYIHAFFATAKLGNRDLVKSSSVIYNRKNKANSGYFVFTPFVVFGILSIIIVYCTYCDYKRGKRSRLLDAIMFGLTGLIGTIIALLWFATDHTATALNYNVLWAFPLNLLALAQVLRSQQKPWFRKYIKFLIILLALMALHWLLGMQIFALSLLPLVFALTVRYIYLARN